MIDSRIVNVQFDNKGFEPNANQTINTLKKLKEGLNLSEAGKGLTSLQNTAAKFSMSGMESAVETIASRFSILGITGVTILENLVNSAVNTGKRLVEALSIAPVMEGFNEYETKMNAVQVIMTNTASKGTKMNEVVKTLDDLNIYADKTIYNFAEMTRNIGTFTAAGVDLKTSAESIKGIANLAAASGSSSFQASTAMYQLSQAIASGTVKLIDWNSVVNAGMGGELFQKALEKTAVKLGKGRDMSVSFRESLQDGWLTTKVLTTTLKQFSEDANLMKAATQVKTITQLWETMRESVQSSWAKTWEMIIGDKEEAAVTLTGISNVFNHIAESVATARNGMLAYWKANGGREAIIQALSNSFQALMDILTPIKEAFTEIFPPMTAVRLVEISKSIRDITENFKIGVTTAENIRRTFAGVFAIFDIGKQIITALGSSLISLVKYLWPTNTGFLSTTASIGDFIVKIDKSLKSANTFKEILNKIGEGIQAFGNKIITFLSPAIPYLEKTWNFIKLVFGGIIKAFKDFASIDTSAIESFGGKMAKRFEPFVILGGFVVNACKLIIGAFMKLSPVVKFVADLIGIAFDKISTKIKETFSDVNFNSAADALNSGLFLMIILGVKRFVDNLAKITDKGGSLKVIVNILDGVKVSLQSYQQSIKAKTLETIAIAIGILAASLLVLSMIDSKKLTVSLGALTALFTNLFGAMTLMTKVMGPKGFAGMGTMGVVMVAISTSAVMLAGALKLLSTIDSKRMASSLTGLTVSIGVIIAASKLMQMNTTSVLGMSVSLVVISTALIKIADVLKKIGTMNWSEILRGLSGMAGSLAISIGALRLLNGGLIGASAVLILAPALEILAMALNKYGKMSWSEILRGLSGLGGSLVLVVAALNVLNGGIMGASAVLILAPSLIILSNVLKRLGDMSWSEILRGLTSLAGSLTILVTALKILDGGIFDATAILILAPALIILSNALKKMGDMNWSQIDKSINLLWKSMGILVIALNLLVEAVPGAASVLIVAPALMILANAFKDMGSMTWGEIKKSMTLLLESMTILVIALNLLLEAQGGAVAVLIVAAALRILAPALKAFGDMSMGEIGKSFLVLAGVFAILGASSALLSPVIPVMLGLAAAITLLGIGMVAVGGGLLLFSMGLASLAVSGVAGASALVIVLKTFVTMIPTLQKAVYESVIGIAQTIIKSIPTILKAASSIMDAIAQIVKESAPKIVQAITTLLVELLKGLDKILPKLIETIGKLIETIIKEIDKRTPKLIESGASIVKKLLKGISEQLPDLIDGAYKMMIAFLNGLTEAINKNQQPFIDAVTSLITTMGDTALQALSSLVGQWYDKGAELFKGLINGILSKLGEIATSIGTVLSYGVETVENFVSSFWDAGVNVVNGLINGIKSKISDVVDAAVSIGTTALSAAKAALDIHSPSREFEKIGKYVVQGYIKGIKSGNKDSMEALQKWLDTKKYFNQLTLDDELKTWQMVAKANVKNYDDRLQADKEIYRIQKEITQANFENSKKWIDKEKYYKLLSLDQELAAWKRVQAQYKIGSEQREEVDREVYRVQQEILQANFEKSKQWIDKKKYYNQLSLQEELAAWERVQKKYKEGTEQREEADRQEYQLKHDLASANDDYAQQILDTQKNYNDQRKQIDNDYYQNTQQINSKLVDDINSVTKSYTDAVKDRANSISSAYGLFDFVDRSNKDSLQNELNMWVNIQSQYKKGSDQRVQAEEKIKEIQEKMKPFDGQGLIINLSKQVDQIKEWESELQKLRNKKISKDLMKELEQMGPASLDRIKALNSLQDYELNSYNALYNEKHRISNEESERELSDLKETTITQINTLTTAANNELYKYKEVWYNQITNLTYNTNLQLDTLKRDWIKKVGDISTTTEKEFVKLTQNVKNVVNTEKWDILGDNIISGMVWGIQQSTTKLANQAAASAKVALDSAKKALGIKSPSKEFQKVGDFAMLGLINGIVQNGSDLEKVTKNMAYAATNTLRNTFNTLLNSDLSLQPTIKPVLDTSDIDSTLALYSNGRNIPISSTFGNKTINGVSSINQPTVNNVSNNTVNNNNKITLQPMIYVTNESDVSKVSDVIDRTIKKYSNAKGVQV